MLDQEMVHRDLGPVEERFVSARLELSFLLATKEETEVALARAQEDAAIEAQDVLSQADEALVMG